MIYFVVLLILVGIGVLGAYLSKKLDENWIGLTVFSLFLMVIWILIPIGSAVEHYHDLGTVEAQHYVIKVQEERIDNLKKNLNEITVSIGTDIQILLNADSPIKSIVEQLAVAETSLARAKTTLAIAKIDITKRKIGFFKFVTYIF